MCGGCGSTYSRLCDFTPFYSITAENIYQNRVNQIPHKIQLTKILDISTNLEMAVLAAWEL